MSAHTHKDGRGWPKTAESSARKARPQANKGKPGKEGGHAVARAGAAVPLRLLRGSAAGDRPRVGSVRGASRQVGGLVCYAQRKRARARQGRKNREQQPRREQSKKKERSSVKWQESRLDGVFCNRHRSKEPARGDAAPARERGREERGCGDNKMSHIRMRGVRGPTHVLSGKGDTRVRRAPPRLTARRTRAEAHKNGSATKYASWTS